MIILIFAWRSNLNIYYQTERFSLWSIWVDYSLSFLLGFLHIIYCTCDIFNDIRDNITGRTCAPWCDVIVRPDVFYTLEWIYHNLYSFLLTVSVSPSPSSVVNHRYQISQIHNNDVLMSAMASQIISLMIVDQRKHQSFASLAFVSGIHRWPVNSLHKGPVTRKMFPFDDVIMCGSLPWEYHSDVYMVT